jgi:hypothetical protein
VALDASAPGLKSDTAGELALFVSATIEPLVFHHYEICNILCICISKNILASSPPLVWPTMFIFCEPDCSFTFCTILSNSIACYFAEPHLSSESSKVTFC